MHIRLSSALALYRNLSYPGPPIQYTLILPVNPDNCIPFQQVQVLNRGFVRFIQYRFIQFQESDRQSVLVGVKDEL
jgi:hypothetical protein